MPPAFAGPDAEKCKSSSKQATNDCQQAANSATSGDNADAGATSAAAGTAIKPNADAGKAQALRQVGRLNAAKDKCQQDQQKCSSDCDKAKQQADQKVAQGQSQKPPCSQSPCPEAKADQGEIPGDKESMCMAPIAAMMGQLGDGANAAQQAANGDGNTAGKSGGMPPIPPIPPPSDKPTPPPTPTPTPDLMAKCGSDPNAAVTTTCTTTMVQKCTPGLSSNAATDPTCDTFTMRYCNAAPSPTATSTSTSTSSTDTGSVGFSTDAPTRPGAGVGTSYCNTAIAKDFCQNTAHAQCQTCQNYRNTTSDACKANPTQCQGTMFGASCPDVEPPIATTTPPSGTSPTTGGSGTGGGGGGELFSGSAPKVATKEGAAAGSASGLHLDMATNDGGGGGGSSSSSNYDDDFLSKYRPKTSALAGANPASATASRSPASTDIGSDGGSSLFHIQSSAIKRMCDGNRLRHCGRIN